MNNIIPIEIIDTSSYLHIKLNTIDDIYEPRCICMDCDHLYPIDCVVAKCPCCTEKKPELREVE